MRLEISVDQARAHLADWLGSFHVPIALPGTTPASASFVLERTLELLRSRRHTHESRAQSARHVSTIQHRLTLDIESRRSLRFFYDLGPGYHASISPDFTDLRFEPGLGELLALRQIKAFAQEVSAIYPAGVHFGLVIDDLCAWVTNEVPLPDMGRYVERLKSLVSSVGMDHFVEVVVESERLSAGHYLHLFESRYRQPTHQVSTQDQINVSRFVGRLCSTSEVSDRMERYARAQAVSEHMMSLHLDGVRLTQRATSQSLGFRAYPGADTRLQCGEVVLLIKEGGAPQPLLITCRNAPSHELRPIKSPDLPLGWPAALGNVFLARRQPAERPSLPESHQLVPVS